MEGSERVYRDDAAVPTTTGPATLGSAIDTTATFVGELDAIFNRLEALSSRFSDGKGTPEASSKPDRILPASHIRKLGVINGDISEGLRAIHSELTRLDELTS